MQTPFFASGWNRRNVPKALAHSFATGTEYTEDRCRSPEFEGWTAGARIRTDPAKRAGMTRKTQEILRNEGGIIVPAFFVDTAVLQSGCTVIILSACAGVARTDAWAFAGDVWRAAAARKPDCHRHPGLGPHGRVQGF
jgi:hypothetical protein